MIYNFTDIELENEQWRDIYGYDGMYQVSDLGRVRSKHSGEWKVMKAIKNGRGYLHLDLSKDGKKKTLLVHRLVANAFIPNNDSSKTLVNHIDECKQNNRMDNLEYCTASYNVTYNDIHHRRKQYNCKHRKLKDIYDPNLTYEQNIELFKSKGIECSTAVIQSIRKELDLTNNKRCKIKDIYDHNLSIAENIEIFKANGIECSERTVRRLRKDLGLIGRH